MSEHRDTTEMDAHPGATSPGFTVADQAALKAQQEACEHSDVIELTKGPFLVVSRWCDDCGKALPV